MSSSVSMASSLTVNFESWLSIISSLIGDGIALLGECPVYSRYAGTFGEINRGVDGRGEGVDGNEGWIGVAILPVWW